MLRAMRATPIHLARTQAGVRAVAEALFHGRSRPAPPARLDWVAAEVVDILGYAGTRARLLFRLCLLMVQVLAPLSIGRLTSLGRLEVEARVRALGRLERTSLGAALVLAIKALLCTIWYEHPDAAREIGAYEPCDTPRLPHRLPLLAEGHAPGGAP